MTNKVESIQIIQLIEFLEFLDLFDGMKLKELQMIVDHEIKKEKEQEEEEEERETKEKKKRQKKEKEKEQEKEKEKEKEQENNQVCNLDFSKLSFLALSFVSKSKTNLTTTANSMGYEIRCKKPSFVQILKENKPLTRIEIRELRIFIEKWLYKPEIFNYEEMSTKIIKSIKNWMIENFDCLQGIGLEKVYVTQNEPIGEEWSTIFDISFCAGGDFGNEIGSSNPLKFSKAKTGKIIIGNWEQNLAIIPNRIYLDFWYRQYLALPHEFVHCVQSKLKQVDKTVLNWSAEHDASFLAHSILVGIDHSEKILKENRNKKENKNKKEEEVPFLFEREGFLELLLLHGAEMAYKHYLRFTNEPNLEVEKLYSKWINSFGLIGPDEGMELKKGTELYFKARVAMEGIQFDYQKRKKCIETCFKNRTGEVHDTELEIPPEIKIENNVNEIQTMFSPTQEKIWNEMFLNFLK
ncbi:protein restricted tev movement 2 [Anaeramoeba flamelloides]|uniref:Protein restricted tev movement 2 n=1 Tax=Anaeramoeba flamelloides TaxID=1746091 RepID=A0ABQ8XRJ9_9EUKA|nr:protein restricted tev movement 2 [Anaeramoeba flamelloides]